MLHTQILIYLNHKFNEANILIFVAFRNKSEKIITAALKDHSKYPSIVQHVPIN